MAGLDDLLNEIYGDFYSLLDQLIEQNVADGGDCVLWARDGETAHEALIELAARHGCDGPLQERLERDCDHR